MMPVATEKTSSPTANNGIGSIDNGGNKPKKKVRQLAYYQPSCKPTENRHAQCAVTIVFEQQLHFNLDN